jgi:hypothetical protein
MKYFFIFLAFAPFSAAAQSPLTTTENKSAYAFLNMYGLNGKLIPVNAQFNSEGFPYFTESFTKGVVKFSNGIQSSDLFINYNLLDNTLRFRKDSTEYIMMDVVSAFILTDVTGVNCEFKNNFPAVAKKTKATFYQVLSDGNKIKLLKYTSKKVVSNYKYGLAETTKIESISEYYILDVANAKLIEIRKSIKSIIKALPSYTGTIDKYISKSAPDVKNDEQLVTFVKYLDLNPI